jgi:hypothetical protein
MNPIPDALTSVVSPERNESSQLPVNLTRLVSGAKQTLIGRLCFFLTAARLSAIVLLKNEASSLNIVVVSPKSKPGGGAGQKIFVRDLKNNEWRGSSNHFFIGLPPVSLLLKSGEFLSLSLTMNDINPLFPYSAGVAVA